MRSGRRRLPQRSSPAARVVSGMHDRLETAARILAVLLTTLVGIALATATPMLLFFGEWAGSDTGSVGRGIAIVLGVPWLTYSACAAAIGALLKHRKPFPALLIAIALIYPVIWLARNVSAW